jgi:hypothetical protein
MTRSSIARSTAALLLALGTATSTAAAQTDSAAAKGKAGMYDASQSISLTGVTVVRIDTVRASAGNTLNAVLASGTDSVTAWLAPVDFLTSNSMTLAAGDVIDIIGAKVMVAGKPSLIASEIKKGESKVTLRDKATGAPAWPAGGGAPTSRPPEPASKP